MKRVYITLIMLIFTIFLFACSKENQLQEKTQIETATNEEISVTPTEKGEVKDQQSSQNEQTSPVKKETIERQEMRDISSVELIKEMKIGWNLGNTMDATGGNGVNSELSWGNPLTNEEMIKTIKAAGFNILRIPITWEKHLGPAPDYIIDEAWLNRVQTIVNYGIDSDMFVIINMHHEDWHFPSYENADNAKDILTKVWRQIADRFENYDEHLIFEDLNEPRMKGTNVEWTGGNEEGRDVVNQLNAAFIDTIRNSGGNNPLRHLMIPPYAASSDPITWSNFIVPEDDKVIVSIHAYTPWNFTLNEYGTSEWTLSNSNDTWEIDNLMNNIYESFISKGIPVIIGEFGARDKENMQSRVEWAEYYVQSATEKGIPCIWWDNGAFTGEGELFGILDRRGLSWKYPEIVDALMKGIQ